MSTLIEVDGRRRAPLGKIGRKERTRYLVHEHEDGTIVLSPAVVLTEREAALLANPALVDALHAGLDQARSGKISPVDWSMFDDIDD